jgi:uncharacterized membrane protein YfcA
MTDLLALPLAGFLIGALIISVGGGGGIFYVGILTVIFNVPPATAAATSLATIVPTALIGSFSHWRAGNVNIRLGVTMMFAAIAGTVIGSFSSGFLPQSIYSKITGAMLLYFGARMLVSYIRSGRGEKPRQESEASGLSHRDRAKAALFGFLGGAMSGLVGLSGTPPIIAGLDALGCAPLEIVGTSVFVITGISSVGFAMHAGLGNVAWRLVLLLAAGTASGAFLAPAVLSRIGRGKIDKILPPIFVLMTLLMGALEFFK